jgi:methionine aminotransferase
MTYTGLNDFFQKKRDLFIERMADTGFQFLKCEGSYFILADYSALSDLDDMTFAETLTREGGVATIPLSPFYSKPVERQRIVRFCFAKTDETLTRAAELLKVVKWVE